MDNKKKMIIISIIVAISIMLIILVLAFGFKTKDTSETDNNIAQQQQINQISLKAKASGKTLKFTVSFEDIQDVEFDIEKSYNEQFDNSTLLSNAHNNHEAEDDLTNDIKNSVEKCYYRVKAKCNENIVYSNVITIALKKPSSDSEVQMGEEDNDNVENNTENLDEDNSNINPENNEFENEEEYTIEIENQNSYEEDSEDNYTYSDEENNEVEYIFLSESEIDFDLTGYKTATLVANVGPSSAQNKTITWSSSNTSVATVEQNGKVTAKANGTAIITAETSNGKTEQCEIRVITSPTSISLNKSSINLDMLNKREENLIANIYPSTSSDKSVIWTSSNENVAIVDSNGLVTANSNGTAIIKAETSNGKVATCQVNVTTTGSGVYINKSSVTLDLNQNKQVALKATVLPSTTVDKSITWTSSNSSVAIVDSNGLVTAKSEGTTVITARTASGKTSTCQIKVDNQVYKITLNTTSTKIILQESNTVKLSVTNFTPSNASDKTVKWTSSNPNIATVNSDGLVTAKNLGKATITATCGKATATCTVVVKYNKSFLLYYYNTQTRTVSDKGSNTGSTYAFFVYTPDTERCIDSQTLPLVVFMHGSEGSKDPYGQASGLTSALRNNKFDYNAIIISPIAHDKQASYNNNYCSAVKSITDYVSTKYKVNKKQISISGFSNGANGAWKLIKQYKGYFSAGLLVSGGYNTNVSPDGIPIIWFLVANENDNYNSYKALKNYMQNNGLKYKANILGASSHKYARINVFEKTDQYVNWLISQSL